MLARKAIAEWCGVTAESIAFGIKEHGKPYAKYLAVEFNISHLGDMVVCAVDDKPVGIDIEQIRPIDLTIAKRICTDEELLYLFGHTPAEQDFTYTTDTKLLTRFFELWTAKEAYGKLVGVGIKQLVNNKNYVLIKQNKYLICACASTVECAIILLSADDIVVNDKHEFQSYRARQNVIFEMGLFSGVLGRDKVIVLYEPNADYEFPSDIIGIYYTAYSDNNKWKQELKVNLEKIGFEFN